MEYVGPITPYEKKIVELPPLFEGTPEEMMRGYRIVETKEEGFIFDLTVKDNCEDYDHIKDITLFEKNVLMTIVSNKKLFNFTGKATHAIKSTSLDITIRMYFNMMTEIKLDDF